MENIDIFSVRDLCESGEFRVFVRDGGIFLEDVAAERTVQLDAKEHEPTAALSEAPKSVPHTAAAHGSRVERMFGRRDTWQRPTGTDMNQGPYKGFLLIRCEECGAVRAFCAKREMYAFRCVCGHETPLENLRPLFVRCKCGGEFTYKTNLTDERVTHTCLNCKAPVELELNAKGTAYVTVGERR